jgi:hypothetical protein
MPTIPLCVWFVASMNGDLTMLDSDRNVGTGETCRVNCRGQAESDSVLD